VTALRVGLENRQPGLQHIRLARIKRQADPCINLDPFSQGFVRQRIVRREQGQPGFGVGEPLVGKERPGRIDEVAELGFQDDRTAERLARAVDVHSADLEQGVFPAERLKARQLGRGVARRHVGDALEAESLDLGDQQVEESVLEFLGLLVPGRGLAHITEISVHRDRPDPIPEVHRRRHRHTFLIARLDEDAFKKRTLEHPDEVVDVMGIGGIGEQSGELGRHRDAQPVAQAVDQGRSDAGKAGEPLGTCSFFKRLVPPDGWCRNFKPRKAA
jgi:hypothetical protein